MRCRGQNIWIDILVVRFLPLSFYAKKKVAERKARIRGDCAAIRYAPIRRSFPLMYPPLDCSADSESISLYPKRSASVKPPVSKDLDARIPFKFFRSAKRVHPFLRLLLYN